MNALLLTILGGLINLVLIVLWAIIRAEVKRTLRDINGVSRKQQATLTALVEAENGGMNPDMRRSMFLDILRGKY